MEKSSKAENIAILEKTIEQLQAVVIQLSLEKSTNLPNSSELESLLQSSQKIAQEIAAVEESETPTQSTNELNSNLSSPPTIEETKEEISSSVKTKSFRGILLGTITTVLIIGIVVLTLKYFPSETVEQANEILEIPTIVEKVPESNQSSPVIEEETSKPESQPLPSPKPAPKLEIQPQQGLIAEIQAEVAEITDKYSEDLIRFVEADFLASRLIIRVGEQWNELSDSQKQNIANQILARSQILDFRKLELRDLNDSILARNPVVGDRMVMF